MSKYFRFIVFVVLLLTGIKAGAQTYPVKVTTTLTPPYSLNLTDYGNGAYNKITANIFMADLTQINYMAKVRLLIKGPNNIILRTKVGKEIGPVFLNGGQTEIMTGAEIATLFDPNNIDFVSGLSFSQYKKEGLLPEGVYQFSIEVMDYNLNNIVVSDPNFGLATAWLILNDPPLINFPVDKSTIEPLMPQNIFFQWTPRHTGSPNSAFSVVYDIQMVEIYPADRNPNDAMLTSPVIFEQTVFTTAYNYTIIDPALIEGRWYAFRVRARTVNDLDLFRNQGYSQVYSFYYGKPCAIPDNVKVNPIDATSALVFWDNQQAHFSTEVQYKEKGTSRWYNSISYTNNIIVNDLKPGKTYSFRLAGSCANNTSEYSQEVEYTTTGSGSGKECDLPLKEEVTAVATTMSTAKVSWLTEQWFDQYTFRYRLLTEAGYHEISSREPNLILQNLDVDKIYEYQIQYHCRTDKWVEGNFNTFKITVPSEVLNGGGTGDCFPPLDITHVVNEDLSVEIKWPKDKGASAYRVYWKEDLQATSWDSITTSSTSTILKGLKANTDYIYQIKSVCKDDQLSIASAPGKFNTSVSSGSAKKCPVPKTIPFTVISSDEVKLEWVADTAHTSYIMEYREKNTSFWMATKSTTPIQSVSGLDNTKKYEYHVYAFCGLNTSDFSPVDTFSTSGKPAKAFVCGSDNGLMSITNRTPISSLRVGDKFTAADFELEIKALSTVAPYNGEASTRIPYLKNSSFIFGMENVQINDQKQMYEGRVYLKKANLSIIDPKVAADLQKMLSMVDQGFTTLEDYLGKLDELQDKVNEYIGEIEGGNNVGKVVTGDVKTTHTLNVSVSDASQIKGTASNGQCQLAITADDGSKQNLTVIPPATIKDAKGTIYAVDNSCAATKVAEQITLNKTPAQLDALSNKAVVTFVDYTGTQKYGFSAWNDEYAKSPTEWAARYQLLGSSYRVSSKATEPAAKDLIKATIVINDNTVDKSKVIFASGKGVKYVSKSLGGNDYEVNIVGGPDADAQELYALYPESEGNYISFGKLLVPAYKKLKRSVVLVPVNGTPVPETEIRQKLNDVYNQYLVEWEVRTDANFTDMSWDKNNNGLEVDGSGLLSTLTGEMLALNAAYKAARSIKPTDVYLFVLPKPETAGVRGDMPRAKQFGYLFVDGASKTETARVTAHEVGHGLFLLRHTFDGYGMAKNALPDNLMDYASGEKLSKLQWDVMHDPGIVLGVFEKDEDAKLAVVSINEIKSLANPDGTYTFIAPSGKFITVPAELKAVTFSTGDVWSTSQYIMPIGTLISFTTAEDTTYEVKGNASSLIFDYYTNGKNKYDDVLSKSQDLSIIKPIIGVPCYDNGVHQFRLVKLDANDLDFDSKRKVAPYYAAGKYATFDFLIDKVSTQENNYIKLSNEIGESKYILANVTKLNSEAEEFIAVHAAEANCASGAAAYYVYTHALQINEYPLLYRYCATEFLLNNPDYLIAPDVKSYDPDQYQKNIAIILPDNTNAEVITEDLSGTVVKERLTITPPSYKQMNDEIDRLFKPLHEARSIEAFKTVLDQMDKYECLIKSISINDRLYYLDQLIEDGSDEHILKWFRNTPLDDREAVVTHLVDNPAMIKKAWNNISGDELDEFINLLTHWYLLVKDIDKEKYRNMPPPQVLTRIDQTGENSTTRKTEYFVLNDFGLDDMTNIGDNTILEYKIYSTYSSDISIKNTCKVSKGGENPYYRSAEFDGGLFDLVVLEAGEGFENYSDDFKKGDRILVPALYAHWMIYRYNQDKSWKKLAIAAEAIFFVATLGEGSVAVIAIEGLVASTNIVVTIYDKELNGTSDGRAFMDVWNTFDAVYGIFSIGSAIRNSKAYTMTLDGLTSKYNSLSNLDKQKMILALSEISTKMAKLAKGTGNIASNILLTSKKIAEWTYSLKVSSMAAFSTSTYKSMAHWVGNEIKAYVISGSIYYSVATTTLSDAGEIILKDINWVKGASGVNRIGQYNNVRYISPSGSEVMGNLEILKAADGTIFIREILSATSDGQIVVKSTGEIYLNEVKIGSIASGVLTVEEGLSLSKAQTIALDNVQKVLVDGFEVEAKNVKLINSGGKLVCEAEGAYCFVAGTTIHKTNSIVPIEDIKVGDKVKAFDHKSGLVKEGNVSKLFRKTSNKLVRMVAGTAIIFSTLEHPYFADGDYVKASDLKSGDSILALNGRKVAVQNVSIIDTTVNVFNFEVDTYHNYYVGSTGLLVHNTCALKTIYSSLDGTTKEFKDALRKLSYDDRNAAITNLVNQCTQSGVVDKVLLKSRANDFANGIEYNVKGELNKVDGTYLDNTQKKAVVDFIATFGSTSIRDADFIRGYRRIQGLGFDARALLLNKAVNSDIVRLEKLIAIAKNDAQKVANFLASDAITGNYTNFIKAIEYADAMKKTPVSQSVKPRYFNNTSSEVVDINIEHIMNKHTVDHFNFPANYDGANPKSFANDIDYFPTGTTQQQICDWIDEAINSLMSNPNFVFPRPTGSFDVVLSNGMTVKVGFTNQSTKAPFAGTGKYILGQFYPQSNFVEIKANMLTSLAIILD